MGKRSNFRRRAMDNYPTPIAAALPLVPYLKAEGIRRFAEPCCGEGDLVAIYEACGFECTHASDIRSGVDALDCDFPGVDAIVSNPPWTRELMHPLIAHFISIAPTWLLIDADWAHNLGSRGLVDFCTTIVPIGRVKWIAGSAHTGKDNACWYRFEAGHSGGPRFLPRQPSMPLAKIIEEIGT